MTESNKLGELLEELGSGLAKLAKDAAAGLGTDYQSILMQDTGWRMPNHMSEMTQDRAQEISNGMIESANSPALEAEREM